VTDTQMTESGLSDVSRRRAAAEESNRQPTTPDRSEGLVQQRTLVRALRRRLPVIAAVTALAAAAGLVLADRSEVTYGATTVIELLDDTIGVSQHTVTSEELEAERQVLQSNQMTAALTSALGERGSSLLDITARADNDSTILTIDVTASDPEAALRGSTQVVDVFTAQRVVSQTESFQAEAAELTARIAEQEEMVTELETELDAEADVTLSSALSTRLFQSVDRSQQLQQVLRELESEITLADGRISVIDRPISTTSSRRSRLLTSLQAGLLGLLASAGAVALLASRSNKIVMVDQLEALYPEIPVLAAVPEFRKEYRERKNSVVVGRPEAMREAEAFRYIRTAVELSSPMGRGFTVAVTSATPGEGKTVSSANLAVSLTAAGRRTLLIDGDLLSPSIPELFGRPTAANTLPDFLRGNDVHELTTTIGTEERALDLLIKDQSEAEPTQRMELAGSDLSDALDRLRDDYDSIVVDCPPALLVADAISLAAAADGVVIVVSLGSVVKGELIRVVDFLTQGGASIMGFVATHADDDGSGYGNYAYETQARTPERNKAKGVTNGPSTTQGQATSLRAGDTE
jgi:capsular exopolysaccharide synthesis family protein